jgi:hypothetical protein
MLSNIVDAGMDSIDVGMAVTVDYLEVGNMTLPVFRLAP